MELLGITHGNKIQIFSSPKSETVLSIEKSYGNLLKYRMAKLQNGKNYGQNITIFISYEWVDHIAVYNYMFRPLSANVRLYYFLL